MRKPIHTSSGDYPVSLGQHALPSDHLIQRHLDTYFGESFETLANLCTGQTYDRSYNYLSRVSTFNYPAPVFYPAIGNIR